MYKILSPPSANVKYEILICMAVWLYCQLCVEFGKVWTTVQFYVETPKIFQHFTDRWVRIRPRMRDLWRSGHRCYVPFGSTNGRLRQETRVTHTANWDSNLGLLIARLPLYSGSRLSKYSVYCKLIVTVSKTVQLRHSDWWTMHNSMLSLAVFGYGEIPTLLPLSAYSSSVWYKFLTPVTAEGIISLLLFIAGDLSHLQWTTRSSQLWSFPSHCPYVGAGVGSGSPVANHELMLKNDTFHLDTLTKAAELHVTACLVGPFQIQ